MENNANKSLTRLANAYWLSLGVLLTIGILSLVLSIVTLTALYSLREAVRNDVQNGVSDYFSHYGAGE